MKFNVTAVVGFVEKSPGLIVGALLPKPQQSYAMAVAIGTKTRYPAMNGYVEKVDSLD